MQRLYCGIVIEGKWYNHFTLKKIKGGTLAILDGADKSGAAKLLNIVKGAIDKLYTADGGSELELNDSQFLELKMADGWKIALEVIKMMKNEEYPKMRENFFCPTCSTPKNERYTELNESWHKLIEDGIIEEHFIDKPEDLGFWVELPIGLEIPAIGSKFLGGTFKKVKRETISFKDALRMSNTPSVMDSESRAVYAHWDLEIVAIEGIDQANINRMIKNNIADSFTQKYLTEQEDIDEMRDSVVKIGLAAEDRPVSCKFCHSQIGGYLDFTNFFAFLFPKKSTQRGTISNVGMV